jgi:hypothetical protein
VVLEESEDNMRTIRIQEDVLQGAITSLDHCLYETETEHGLDHHDGFVMDEEGKEYIIEGTPENCPACASLADAKRVLGLLREIAREK